MELTLKRLLEQAEFTKSRGRYDAQEVDDLLDRAVAMATKVEARLNQAIEEAKAANGPTPAEIEAEVDRRVAAKVADQPAAAPAGPSEEDHAEEALRTIKLAQRTADAAVREAREEAAGLLAEATSRAEALHAETDARAAEARASLESETAAERTRARAALAAEIAEIEAVRESLRTDAALLERHVQEQRTQLRNAIGELQRLLEDPAGFRLPPQPELADPEIPDLSPDPEAAAPTAEPEPAAAPTAAVDPVEAVLAASHPASPPEPDATAPALDPVDHEAPGPATSAAEADLDDAVEGGPPTAAVELGDGPDEVGQEDAFLAELRKAMADDEPLGPRDHQAITNQDELFDDDRRNWRFGKRR